MVWTRVELPYGDETIEVRVPDEKLIGVYAPRSMEPLRDPADVLRRALTDPIGGRPLAELASNAHRVAIGIEDSTRPVPNSLIVDTIASELTAAGVPPDRITVIVATGLHRPMTEEELSAALGRWFGVVQHQNHDARDANGLTPLGTTRLGTRISINRAFMEADLKITTGDVEYHQFCGYGGGAKCVYPGLADADAIQSNHSRMDLPGTEPGRIDGNPVREEIDEVGRLAQVDFNVSVALNASHCIVGVHAGDPDRSFRNACQSIDAMYAVEIPRRTRLVIASPGGYPKDINLYQSQKAIEEATRVVQPGGTVVVLARCDEGSGSDLFEAWMQDAHDANDIIRRIKANFVMGGHKAYQIAREVQRAKVHLYSSLPPGRVRSWFMTPIESVADIDRLIQASESVLVLPQATLVKTRIKSTDSATSSLLNEAAPTPRKR